MKRLQPQAPKQITAQLKAKELAQRVKLSVCEWPVLSTQTEHSFSQE